MEIAEYIIADDHRLVQLALEGDDIAFEYLFNRYSDAIRRLFLQRSTSTEDTDDLLQETFIKVYINLHRYSHEYTFGQWVYTIARNTHIDFERRRQEDISIDETDLIIKTLKKKKVDPATYGDMDYAARRKTFGYLVSKGFSPSNVSRCLGELSEEFT